MHVLFFIHSLSAGGAERVTSTLANHWAAKGWRVTIVTATGCDGDFYALHDDIKRISLHQDVDSSNLLQALLNNFRRIRALRLVLCRQKPDIAVAMMTTANVLLALAGLGQACPTIGSERIYPPAMPLGRAWEIMRRWSYPRLSAIVAQTRQSAEWLRENAPAPRITVIANPLLYPTVAHMPCIHPTTVTQERGIKRVLLAVGRLGEQKGFDRLIQAFAAVSRDCPEWGLVILGEGGCREALGKQATALGLSGRIWLPGLVGNIGEWYEASDLYVLTSLFEGFPNTLVEALGHGLPVVSVDCDTGPREIVRHKYDGLLVPTNDNSSLVKALTMLMKDKELRTAYGKRGIEVRERFSIDRIASSWESLFSMLIRIDA